MIRWKLFFIITSLAIASFMVFATRFEKSLNASTPRQYTASIVFCGDVMLDWGIKDVYKREGADYPLRKITGFLKAFDYSFCNLECPVSSNGTPHIDKKYIFLAEPGSLDILRLGNIRGVTLANNHSSDFGETALLNTMTVLNEKGIHYTGAGIDAESAHLPVLLKINGISMAIFGYTNLGYPETYAQKSSPGIARAQLDLIRRDILKFRGFNDVIIISMHWGDEYSHFPSGDQVELAHAIIDSGADAIIGHHSHIYQGIEIYKEKPVIYSLGNFLFGSINEDIKDNIVVALRFIEKRLSSLEVYPVNGNSDPLHRFQPRIMNGDQATVLLNHLVDISRPLNSVFPGRVECRNSILYCSLIEKKQ